MTSAQNDRNFEIAKNFIQKMITLDTYYYYYPLYVFNFAKLSKIPAKRTFN